MRSQNLLAHSSLYFVGRPILAGTCVDRLLVRARIFTSRIAATSVVALTPSCSADRAIEVELPPSGFSSTARSQRPIQPGTIGNSLLHESPRFRGWRLA